ncbi:hypothetical protein [Azoarcus olearius]|uniref:Conserved hypothetical secreted protein n=1 Tax=Azoarcus sp. (strain BH72) TaxID=418699 RepID=A1K3T6_AZOSB|nr:hypothetical protein [Azoarcus olearius]ANQ84013.1 hypothetical protein dqs_0945 [Azoarcus olearius]CAL93491.1 conserved hypothetical secreted protein [Azoarcus olearius]
MITRLRRVLLLAALPLLAACENSATAYSIEGSQHALILVREQSYFWDSEIKQAIVASRLPQCQKRVAIHPGSKVLTEVLVYEAGDRLWALQQGNRWYLASTERCLVQDWDKPADAPLGPLVGSFRLRDGAPAFVPAQEAAPVR